MTPTRRQREILRAMASGATLYRDSVWVHYGTLATSAGVQRVSSQTIAALLSESWIQVVGVYGYTLTRLGRREIGVEQ